MNWLTDRLKERSTWLAIAAMLGFFGFQIDPELRDLVINALIPLAAIVAFLFKENDRDLKIELPGIELQSKSELESQFDERGFNRQGRHDRDDGYVNLDSLKSGLGYSNEDETVRNPADHIDVDRRLRINVPHGHISGSIHDELQSGFENK